jgi:hypothetical protein
VHLDHHPQDQYRAVGGGTHINDANHDFVVHAAAPKTMRLAKPLSAFSARPRTTAQVMVRKRHH